MRTPEMSRLIDLTGRVIVVTGGAGDIGSAVAAHAARLGAMVVIADNGTSVTGVGDNPEIVTQVAKRLSAEGGAVVGYHCDLTDAEQVESMFEDLFAEHGNIHAVVAAAGTLRVQPIWETSPDDWRNVLDSHATHTYLVAAAACRRWRANSARRSTHCALVNFTAATGLVGRPDLGVTHSAAKGAVAGMTLELAHEMYPYDVSVNAVAAANVRGRMADHVSAQVSPSGEEETFDTSSPNHAGILAAYLASGDASFITGQVFRVMGGLIGRYRRWEVTESIDKGGFWTVDDVRLGVRRLFDAYPEYKALQGPHREF